MVLLQQAVAYIFRKKTRNLSFSIYFDIILLYFVFSYASWWRNGGTNQEVKWGKFDLVSKERGSAFSWKEGAKISHLSDVIQRYLNM